VPLCYLDYYGSLVQEAFHQTVGIAKLEQLPLTFVIAVLAVGFFVLWKRYIEREPVKDWKASLFATIASIALVCVIRFLWNATFIPIERQRVAERQVEEIKIKSGQTIDGLKSQIESQKDGLTAQISGLKDDLNRQKDQANQITQRCNQEKQDRTTNLAAAINAIEKDNYPQRLLDAKAAADAATNRKISAEAAYDACRKAGAMGCPGLFGNMQRIEQEEITAKGQFGQVVSELDSRLNALRE
jgi:hypothetical protein